MKDNFVDEIDLENFIIKTKKRTIQQKKIMINLPKDLIKLSLEKTENNSLIALPIVAVQFLVILFLDL